MMATTLETAGDNVIETIERRRIGKPADMGEAAIYLSSKASSNVSGIVQPVDGGPDRHDISQCRERRN